MLVELDQHYIKKKSRIIINEQNKIFLEGKNEKLPVPKLQTISLPFIASSIIGRSLQSRK